MAQRETSPKESWPWRRTLMLAGLPVASSGVSYALYEWVFVTWLASGAIPRPAWWVLGGLLPLTLGAAGWLAPNRMACLVIAAVSTLGRRCWEVGLVSVGAPGLRKMDLDDTLHWTVLPLLEFLVAAACTLTSHVLGRAALPRMRPPQ